MNWEKEDLRHAKRINRQKARIDRQKEALGRELHLLDLLETNRAASLRIHELQIKIAYQTLQNDNMKGQMGETHG